MENNNEVIINAKVKKPLTEAQKEKQRLNMRNYYLASRQNWSKTLSSVLNQ